MDNKAGEISKPKLTFAKVAASATSTPKGAPSRIPEAPIKDVANEVGGPRQLNGHVSHDNMGGTTISSVVDGDKFTPRPSKSLPVRLGTHDQIEIGTTLPPQSSLLTRDVAAPVSEENVTKLPSTRPPPSTSSFDGKSTTSGTTFPLDEKESLRPDDSASAKAHEEDDARGSTQPSSRMGSDPGARAFSEQLREISIMGPPSSRVPPIPRTQSANVPTTGTLYHPSPIAVPSTLNGVNAGLNNSPSPIAFPPDEKLLEALTSVRDRVWVLKLEQDITDFVRDPTAQSFDLPNCNAFYRMLAHKMADYYLLGHTMNESSSGVRLYKTPNCRIPPRLSEVTNPSTAASTPPPMMPQMKILRRDENGTRPSSRGGALEADDGSDLGKGKFPATREEREARYEAARLRIMGSAKPSEDDPALPARGGDSTSNSVVGKSKKPHKQRRDSEDGFEARSAYNMYPQGAMQPDLANLPQMHSLQGSTTPMGYVPDYSYSAGTQHASGYDMSMHGSPNGQQWMMAGQSPMPQSPQSWGASPYGTYDLNAHMSQMSFQSSSGMMGYSSVPDMPSNMPYGSPGLQTNIPVYQNPQQQFAHGYMTPYQGQSYAGGQTFPYGATSMNGTNGTWNQHVNASASGAFSRQYFNPQTQAFVPGYPGPQHPSSPYQPHASPALSHASITNNHVPHQYLQNHVQAGYGQPMPSLAQARGQGQQPSFQHPPHMTHPLPQPVFAETQSQVNTSEKRPMKPPERDSFQESSIAKFKASASLPAKPPPTVGEQSIVERHARTSYHNRSTEMNEDGGKSPGVT